MNKIIALTAAVSMLGATAALSQTTQPETQPQATPPQTGPQQTTPPAGTPPSPQVQKEQPAPGAKPGPGEQTFLQQQQPGQMLASNLMGKSVLGPNNERIGDINDLVLAQDGKVIAVVVGVGGFLGIGEKNVAIPFERVTVAPTGDQVTTQLTRQELEQAPQFVTARARDRGTPPSQQR